MEGSKSGVGDVEEYCIMWVWKDNVEVRISEM